MVERIDVLMPPRHRSGYGVIPYFTRHFVAALSRQGVNCRLLGGDSGLPMNLIGELMQDPPDCTLSFNGLLPDDKGRFLCDIVQVPHVAYLLDSPNKFLSMARSPGNIATFVDQQWADFFLRLGHRNTLFLPQAAERSFQADIGADRPYPVTFLGTCFDINALRASWNEQYSPAMCAVMDTAVEIALGDQVTSYIEAFTQAMDQRLRQWGDVDPNEMPFAQVLEDIELLIRGRDRIELLLSIKDIPVHVFGLENGGDAGWDHYLKRAPGNITFHGAVTYPEGLEIMKQSRIIVNSCPSIKWGAHERIFSGFLAGAAVLTNDNGYIRHIFEPYREILLYRHDAYDQVTSTLQRFLDSEADRSEMIERARQKVLAEHTWDHRAHALISHLDAVLPMPDVWQGIDN